MDYSHTTYFQLLNFNLKIIGFHKLWNHNSSLQAYISKMKNKNKSQFCDSITIQVRNIDISPPTFPGQSHSQTALANKGEGGEKSKFWQYSPCAHQLGFFSNSDPLQVIHRVAQPIVWMAMISLPISRYSIPDFYFYVVFINRFRDLDLELDDLFTKGKTGLHWKF